MVLWCPLPKSTIWWHDKTMPIGCGLFQFRNSKPNKYSVTNNFSRVVAVETLKKGVYKIFPRTGEVWALYKNWSAQLVKGNNIEDFDYEIAEIVNVSDNFVDVKFLVLAKGFKSVYMARVEEEVADKVVKICVLEHLRFSHQIPVFCLTEERGGRLRGFWESNWNAFVFTVY
uniref:DNAJ heat shock N-terminal domain-containing protein n=1 Tax=Solanum tuberosum TaxID=4113 RepID=M1DA22_SOLTU